jgi:hypothetical protein
MVRLINNIAFWPRNKLASGGIKDPEDLELRFSNAGHNHVQDIRNRIHAVFAS